MNSRISTAAAIGAGYQVLNSLLFIFLPKVMVSLIYSSLSVQVLYIGFSFLSYSALAVYFLQFPVTPVRPWAKFSCTILMFIFGFESLLMLVNILTTLLRLEIGMFLFASNVSIYIPLFTAVLFIYFFSQFSKKMAGLSKEHLLQLKIFRYILFIPIGLALLYLANRFSSSPLSEWIFENKMVFNQLSSLLALATLFLFIRMEEKIEQDIDYLV